MREAKATITQLGFADEEIMQISMAVREAAVNAVLHRRWRMPGQESNPGL